MNMLMKIVCRGLAITLGMLVAGFSAGAQSLTGAQNEFARYYKQITGRNLPNGFLRLSVDASVSSTGMDAYDIRNEDEGVSIVGSNVRSVYYGVYDLLERRGGCRWFWDGDVVPARDEVDFSGLDVHEESRLEYRGLRYFAHRGLTRFQAEHWGFDDWKREIDWMLKRRLNVFMLRIGQDDLFQRAFPEVCSYPDPSKPLEGHGVGFDNRTLFWSLEFRGRLRAEVQKYGRDRGLMIPEDVGSMTHWYSRTPKDYLDKKQPEFLPQTTTSYSERNGLVWDIRKKKWIDEYWQLAKTGIEQFGGGNPRLLHLMGLGERLVSTNAQENYQIKMNGQKEFMNRIRAEYPEALIMHPGWDYYFTWKPEEVRSAIDQYDPKHEILWDYEGDAVRDYTDKLAGVKNNFTKWGVIGRFPYTYSTFLAYCEALDMRANYPLIEDRQRLVQKDSFCRGYIFWPEASHTDTLFLRYFTENAWSKDLVPISMVLPEFCRDRYGSAAEQMKSIWERCLPASYLFSWDGNYEKYAVRRVLYRPEFGEPSDPAEYWSRKCVQMQPAIDAYEPVLAALTRVDWSGEFVRRDTVDIMRMIGDRMTVAQNALMMDAFYRWKKGLTTGRQVIAAAERYAALGEGMAKVLALHTDFSIWDSYVRLTQIAPIPNPDFPQVLLENATCDYCASHHYEAAEYWYKPVMRDTADRIIEIVRSGDKTANPPSNSFFVKMGQRFRKQSLGSMRPTLPRTPESYHEVLQELLAVQSYEPKPEGTDTTVVVAEKGRTEYVISIDAKASATDRFAAKELAEHLFRATGVRFPVVVEADTQKTIEIGTARAKRIISGVHPLDLEEEESVYVICKDGRIAVAGGGKTGNAYGVYSFLERELGCKWLTAQGDECVPRRSELRLKVGSHAEKPWIEYRGFCGGVGGTYDPDSRDLLFYFRNRVNQIQLNYRNAVPAELKDALVPRMIENHPTCHSLFNYIPPEKYFKDHPDWFTMDSRGKRTETAQLCFSNPELRAEMTRNFIAQAKKVGGRGFLDISQRDQNGPLCLCPDCRADVERYKTPGAPLYVYLHELGRAVKAACPEITIHFLAYRKDSTQRPPVGMEPFPDNVAVVFAPLDDDFSKDMAHDNNIATWQDYHGWLSLAKTWLWSYPSVYTPTLPPYGGLERAHSDIRILFRDGLTGTTIEHDVGKESGSGFFDMQMWMLLKCLQDPESDWKKLRGEYCAAMYGAAAADVVAYDDYLEKGRRGMKDFLACVGMADSFMTVDDIIRWETRFESMERKASGDMELVQRLREVRIPLDVQVLVRWAEIKGLGMPAGIGDVDSVYARLDETYRKAVMRRYTRLSSKYVRGARDELLSDKGSFVKLIKSRLAIAKSGLKDLPREFSDLPSDRIVQIVPVPPSYGETFVEDPEAAAGFARLYMCGDPRPEKISVKVGVYDRNARRYAFSRNLSGEEIELDKYKLYHVGKYKFPSGSCHVSAFENPRFRVLPTGAYREGAENELDVWVSMKFEGPAYGGKTKDGMSRAAMDRVVLVKKR